MIRLSYIHLRLCADYIEGKMAMEITSKRYCSTKNALQWYKITSDRSAHRGIILFPAIVVLSLVAENNLTVFKNEYMHTLPERPFLLIRFIAISLSLVKAIRLRYLFHIRRLTRRQKSSNKDKKTARYLLLQVVSKSDGL